MMRNLRKLAEELRRSESLVEYRRKELAQAEEGLEQLKRVVRQEAGVDAATCNNP